MVSQLKGLLGKSGRPIIVCGKLFTADRLPFTIRLENWHTVFELPNYSDVISVETCDKQLEKMVMDFERTYGRLFAGYRENSNEVQIFNFVDPFTGAVVVETQTYRELVDERLHDQSIRYTAEQERLARQFNVQQLQNYFEIYLNLMNRRLVAQHMPMLIKSHMVKGLFQPMIVETAGIISPFKYGENQALFGVLRPFETYLERKDESIRKLNFSCIAMCDIASAFGIQPIKELDRRNFMVMMTLAMLSKWSQDASQFFYQRYGYFTTRIRENSDEFALLTIMSNVAQGNNMGLKVV